MNGRRVVFRNLRGAVTGDVGASPREVDSIVCADGAIIAFDAEPEGDDVVVDTQGATACPGLVDSHVHTTFGDWTPRQATVGWIESYMHGGTTMMMSASEVHVPNRPRDRDGLMALAVAAQRSWHGYRPGGVKVLGGSLILDSCLREEDFAALAAQHVHLAKLGFGMHPDIDDARRLVRAAQAAGFLVMNHTGGASIPGSMAITVADVLAVGCDIIGHANGGPTSLPDEDLAAVFDAPGAIQLVQAGNLRSAIRLIEIALRRDQLARVLIATDTPTGTGVMPLGMLKSVVELCSLTDLSATDAIACASGNPARVLRRAEGRLAIGSPADLVLLQPPLGGAAADALTAIRRGDIPGIAGVVIDGEIRATRSRNTPAPARELRVA